MSKKERNKEVMAKIDEIRKQLDSYKALVDAHRAEEYRLTVTEGDNYSDNYKDMVKAKTADNIKRDGRQSYQQISPMIADLLAIYEDSGQNLDFVADPVLTQCVSLIKTLGTETPPEVIRAIKNKYKDNALALKSVGNICAKCNIPHEDIDNMYKDIMDERKNIIGTTDDAIYYNMQQGDYAAAMNELQLLVNRLTAEYQD